MNKREIKEDCYLDLLEEEINSVEIVLNHINRVKQKEGIFAVEIIEKDLIRAQFDLELALASLCILLRKMVENVFIKIDDETRRDINSIIHSNKFEYYDEDTLYVYSQKGKEPVSVTNLLAFARSIL